MKPFSYNLTASENAERPDRALDGDTFRTDARSGDFFGTPEVSGPEREGFARAGDLPAPERTAKRGFPFAAAGSLVPAAGFFADAFPDGVFFFEGACFRAGTAASDRRPAGLDVLPAVLPEAFAVKDFFVLFFLGADFAGAAAFRARRAVKDPALPLFLLDLADFFVAGLMDFAVVRLVAAMSPRQ